MSPKSWYCERFGAFCSSLGQPRLARQAIKKVPELTKKQLAAKARKRALKAKKSIYDSEKMTLSDAIAVLRAVEVTAPNSTYELVIKTAMGKGSAIPKGRYALPREPKTVSQDRILVFADGRQAEEAKKAGADIVGGLELVDGVVNGRHQATLFLSTPSLIRSITPKLGRVLGPRGLMPSERRGTVTEDIGAYIRRLKGTSEWKGDKAGTIRAPIAKLHYPVEDVVKNIRYFLNMVKKATGNIRDPQAEKDSKNSSNPKPVNAITKVILSSPRGPGIQLSDF
ncbi:mitochondrial 54S ribosomal protein mrpl1 [Steccherinum ochraceum]|uniref:Ribosomal protein n=1 Tax=Steccherinum ochraceum TaxID=92696 RepID=A0A4R0RUA1_9APHY|nr:mitochondrial 54S ribosomal protein mrpl1 [Steccherinum ochraceum]